MLAPLLFALALAPGDRAGPLGLQPIGRLDHPPIREASGIVASRRHRGVFWVHNDSGTPPPCSRSRPTGRSCASMPSRSRTSTGKTSRSTTQASSTSARSATTESAAAPGHLPARTSPTRHTPAEGPLADRSRLVLSVRRPTVDSTPKGWSSTETARSSWPRRSTAARPSCMRCRSGPPPRCSAPHCPNGSARSPGSSSRPPVRASTADGLRLAVCSYHVARVYGRPASRRRPLAPPRDRPLRGRRHRGDRLGRGRPDPGRRGTRRLPDRPSRPGLRPGPAVAHPDR